MVSAHRTPGRMLEYARGAAARGIGVIIAGAGGAAHLRNGGLGNPASGDRCAGAVGHVLSSTALDSLLSIVQMPAGVPVATVSIGGGAMPGCWRCGSLASSDPVLRARMAEFQDDLEAEVLAKGRRATCAFIG